MFTWYQLGTKIAVLHTTTLQIFHGNWISIYSGVQELTESWLEIFFSFFPLLCLFEFDFGKTACEKKFVIFFCVWEEVRTRKRGTLFFWPSKWFHKRHIIAGPIFPCHPNSLEMLSSPWFFFYLNFIVWTLAKAQLRTQQCRVMPAHTESCRLIH